jgi:hypothetical protein
MIGDTPTLISSYPKSWTNRYFDLRYQQLDPVVRRARREHDVFSWDDGVSLPTGTRASGGGGYTAAVRDRKLSWRQRLKIGRSLAETDVVGILHVFHRAWTLDLR